MERAQRVCIFDLHCDTLDRLALHSVMPEAGFMAEDMAIPAHRMASLASNDAHIALDRMTQTTDAWCQCFAAFIPDDIGAERGYQVFQVVKAFFQRQLEEHAALIEQARDARDIRPIAESGKCAALLTVEGGSFIVENTDRVHEAADAGVKMLTLTWNAQNAIASGVKAQGGLTFFGRDVVRAMESRRMVVDVSHLNEESFWDVLDVAQRPLAASHSNARALCGHPRNLSNSQLRALIERECVVGLNFCEAFLADAGPATRDQVLRHVDHILELGGERLLSLGSDYDGCDVPDWLAPAEKIGGLHALLAHQFGADIAHAICFENACRFFERNEG